jgi:hypothetical protein
MTRAQIWERFSRHGIPSWFKPHGRISVKTADVVADLRSYIWLLAGREVHRRKPADFVQQWNQGRDFRIEPFREAYALAGVSGDLGPDAVDDIGDVNVLMQIARAFEVIVRTAEEEQTS